MFKKYLKTYSKNLSTLKYFKIFFKNIPKYILKTCFLGVTSFNLQSELSQYLFYGGFCSDGGVIGITQPRRVAAVSVEAIRFDDMILRYIV